MAEDKTKQDEGGFWKWLDNTSRDLFPDVLLPVAKGVDKVNQYVLKPVIRESLILSQDAGTLLEWSLGELYADARDQITGKAEFGRSTPESRERFKSFSEQFITTQREGLGGVGTGYLPGGPAFEASQEAIQRARPRVGSRSFTLGRAGAYPFVQLGIMDEDGLAHQLFSGSIDAYKIVKNPADPFNWLGRIRPGGTGAGSTAGVGKTRISDAEEFSKYFDDLENKVINLQDNPNSPANQVLTPKQQALVDEYNRIVSPVAPTRTKPYPLTSPNAGAVADTYEPTEIYNYWKPKLDEAFNDISNQAGLINDLAPSFVRNQFQTWKEGGEGTAWAQNIIDQARSGELDVQTLWKSPMFQREGIGTAAKLVELAKDPAATTDMVFDVLNFALADFNPLYNVRNLGIGKIDAVRTNSGAIVKTAAQKLGFRQLEIFPEDLRVGFTDPNQSARNLDNVMGLYNFDYADRNFWLTSWAKASQGTKADIFDFLSNFEKQAVRKRLEDIDIPFTNRRVFNDEAINEITSWSRKVAGQVMNYTIDDMAQNVPLVWLDNGGVGPLRLSQLLSNDYYITPPQFVEEVIQATGKIGAFLKAGEQVPVVGGVIRGADWASDTIRTYMSQVWKPSRVAKVSHLVRVVPEETLRAAASGIFEHPMEQMLAMLGRTMQTDALGNAVGVKIKNIVKLHTFLNDVQETLKEAQSYENLLNKGNTLTKRQQELVNRIPKLEAKAAELEAQLAADPQAIQDVLIGPNTGRGAKATATGEYKDLYAKQVQRGVLQLPDRTIPNDVMGWRQGMAHELADMARNKDYQRIAASVLQAKDKIFINGKNLTIADHIANNAIHPFTKQPLQNNIDAVKLWLFQGSGRQYFEAYFEDVANLKPQYQNRGWANYATASERVDTILNHDIAYLTGLDQQLLEVVATGKFNGITATSFDLTGRGKVIPELDDYIKNVFINAPHAPRRVRNFVTQNLFNNPKATLGDASDRLFRFYFEEMYGRVSDLASRSPVWRAGYWTRMEELAPFMTPDEAQKLVVAAKKAKITPTRLERIELQAAVANGEGTVEGAQILAEGYARRYTNDLLFNANKKSLFGQQHAILFPFFEAFREVTGTWLKLSAQNPRIVRNVGQSVGTAQEEGWFYTDINGRKVFETPMTSALARIWTNQKNSVIDNFTIGVNAINIAGQMRPGFGPVVQLEGMFIPKAADYDWLRTLISPYRQPDIENAELQSLWTPAWLKQVAAKTQQGDNIWTDVSKLVIGDARKDDYFQRAYSRITQFLANTNEQKYLGTDGIKRLFEDAENMTFTLVSMRGLSAFLGPGAPMTTWLAHTKYGAVDVGIIMDDLFNKETAATKAGEPAYKGFNAWLEQWGEIVWPYVTSLTESTIGGQIATTEYQNWTKENGYILGKYPTVAGYFGPRTGERNFDAYQQQLNVDTRNIADPKENIAEAQNRLGNYLYYKLVDSIPENQMNSVEAKQAKANAVILIEEQLDGWQRPGTTNKVREAKTRDKIAELRAITKDSKLKESPVTKAVADYLAARDQAIAQEITSSKGAVSQTNWTDSKAGKPVRNYLSVVVAPALIASVPEFRDVYEQVLAYEFIVDED